MIYMRQPYNRPQKIEKVVSHSKFIILSGLETPEVNFHYKHTRS